MRISLIARVLILFILLIGLALVLVNTDWFFTPVVFSILITVSLIETIHFLDKTNRELANFFLSIKNAEFSSGFKGKSRGKSFKELFESLEQLLEQFRKLSLEKESNYQYLQALNENIGVAIISFQENGKIQFINSSAKLLLRKPLIDHIDDIEAINSRLHHFIITMKSGDRELIPMILNDEWVQLSVQSRTFKRQDQSFKVILMQNLHHELEEKEVEAWQKLINVLTHEIMNSVTPIVSLIKAVNAMLASNESLRLALSNLEPDERSDFEDSLKTIEQRSQGLLKFINAYREYSVSPEFHPSDFDFLTTLQRVTALMKPELEDKGIKLQLNFGTLKSLNARGDEHLLEQVIINLLKNSAHALSNTAEPLIKLSAKRLGEQRVQLTVSDNGPGVNPEAIDKIFVPFFSTRKGGTGIGLSLSRQIMKLHSGKIYLNSVESGASFTIEF